MSSDVDKLNAGDRGKNEEDEVLIPQWLQNRLICDFCLYFRVYGTCRIDNVPWDCGLPIFSGLACPESVSIEASAEIGSSALGPAHSYADLPGYEYLF